MQTPSFPTPATRLPRPLPDAGVEQAKARADIAACRESLRNGSRTFLAASLLLPRAVHEPASALYAFCRLADDAVDDEGGSTHAVEQLRNRLALAYAGTPQPFAADRALAAVVERFSIPRALPQALLEGFEWDAQGRRYETLDELHDYAARVAGTVGAMMAMLMGVRSPEGVARACDLGVAMQLSNIARDVGDDARMGRLYLPRQWLREVGIDPDEWLARPVFSNALGAVVQRLLHSADVLYQRVDAGVARLPLSCRPGINAARYLYAEIGHEVARRGLNSVDGRAVVPALRKMGLLVRSVTRLRLQAADDNLPPLPATRFLVDAAAAAMPERAPLKPRAAGVNDRIVWLIELFERLERRERAGVSVGAP